MSTVGEFFLNTNEDGLAITAPAFSLTKVMAFVAPLGTVIVATITEYFETGNFTPSTTEVTTLIVAVLGFGAIIIAADVLARAIGTYADKMGKSSVDAAGLNASNHSRMVIFRPPLKANLESIGRDSVVSVVAASDGAKEEYLCVMADGTTKWESAGKFTFPPNSN